jgi:L-ascorbate metabolism protein UlaG (beta-lactamase superfamily)
MYATYFGANGWLLELGGLRVLVDPWLTGALRFPPGAWFFEGQLPASQPVPEDLDLLLLTQGLDDHAHPETLQLLPRSLPVVGSLSAAAKVRSLGFETVTALRPGEDCRHGDLQITATAGAPVPQVENGYLLEHPAGSLYLEPHGYLSPDLLARPLDAVITPGGSIS